ncbi:MAG TPA: DUF2336 domain-containing protein, partial [Candidatus Cybelea sp.]|nr:DUF2336 domain-containing protein [Candidatus Cybelea sp.]
MLNWLLGKARRDLRPVDYEESKQLARDPSPEVRRHLAARPDIRPEILYFLAEDAVPAVRRAIAANPNTPGHANVLLARDGDDDVRCDLARKIGRLLPDLDPQTSTRLREMTIEALETLAQDQLPRVRAMLADALKSADDVPREIVLRLARDIETIVAAPILEYSPLLNDEDLLEIIRSGAGSGRLSAIARRRDVVAPVADAIAATLDVPAVAALLANSSAQIREETLDAIIEHADGVTGWHQPLVQRKELSVRAMRQIAQFVGTALVDILIERHKLADDVVQQLRAVVHRKIDETPPDAERSAPRKRGLERATALHAAGKLDDEAVCDAVENGDRDFAVAALTLLSRLPPGVVTKIIDAQSPKGMTALVWKAGLSMRTAMRLQLRLAMIAPKAVMNARDGVDFPISEADMEWQIGYFS